MDTFFIYELSRRDGPFRTTRALLGGLVCWAGIGTWEWGGLHVGKPGSGQPLQRYGGCPPEAVTSHVEWRILKSC